MIRHVIDYILCFCLRDEKQTINNDIFSLYRRLNSNKLNLTYLEFCNIILYPDQDTWLKVELSEKSSEIPRVQVNST